MNNLEHAIEIALTAHTGDTDKRGATYIGHPLQVMEQMDSETERVVAVLHDVVEDAEYELLVGGRPRTRHNHSLSEYA